MLSLSLYIYISISLPDWNCTHWIFRGNTIDLTPRQAICLFHLFPNSNSRICALQHASKIFSLQSGSLFTIAICTRHEPRFELLTDLGLDMAKRPKATCRSSRGLAMRKIMCSSRILKEAKVSDCTLGDTHHSRNTDKNRLPVQLIAMESALKYWSASLPMPKQSL